ncbi:von Willebrand factor type A domain-containing protein [Desarmillaria tabescens]|uniref:von Willebrand factor type A domain-containing protein n=1 Tax=Armillaria tabescens TaxID=1929756 RepID=A0AA39U3M7_ARMTA|nr:von Willebrand factor type A domain-containing protein [Desarmillaria tabescens]KAK0466380.1 von Willebrand factor type A domain-containing protein [Desarmillaria tabescens]
MEPFSGIVHNGGVPKDTIHLPLEEMSAKVLILDVSSRVTLSQTYVNPSDHPTSKARYYFPVPASAAICSFEMRTSRGQVITGIAKEKLQAREEHEQAVASGRSTALVEWVSDDIFTISIGSILPRETAVIKLVFVMSLMNDSREDSIRFQLPMCVGERYGLLPPDLVSAATASATTRIRVKVDVQTSGEIRQIVSPTHPDEISETKYVSDRGRPSRRRSTVRFRSKTFLSKDFVLIVQADKLDAPRCFAEVSRGRGRRQSDTLALQFAIVPKFNLPPISAQEYLFLVDRSGSMENERIATAKDTLALLLRVLPPQGTTFNIMSFGSSVDGLWAISQAYSQRTLDDATTHIDRMDANYGGTEIRQALKFTLESRQRQYPTAIFVLTDGEAYDIDETMQLIRDTVQSSPSPLRVYTLGIGSTVSSAMCEGIARAGNGVCLFATAAEDIMGKCARLVRAGRSSLVQDVEIDWGIPDQPSASPVSVNFSTLDAHSVVLRPPPMLQQAPTVISNIHAGVRLVVYAIIQVKGAVAPRVVTLRGRRHDTSEPFELSVPIRLVQLVDPDQGHPMVHTLAAWWLIQEHEAEIAPLPIPFDRNVSDSDIRKAAIIRLGTDYQLTSRHTSFVAVDPDNERPRRDSSDRTVANNARTATDGRISNVQNLSSGITNILSGFWNALSSSTPRNNRIVPGAWPNESPSVTSLPSSRTSSNDRPGPSEDDGYETYSTMSSLESSSSEWSEWSDIPPMSEEDARLQRSPSPQYEHVSLASEAEHHNILRPKHPAPPPDAPPLVPPNVIDLMRLQQCDGSFRLDDPFRKILGERAVREVELSPIDEKTWATVLYVAFLMKHMDDQKELRDDLLMKAREFLKDEPDVVGLVERAKNLIA